MLLRFKCRNFYSIRDEQELSLIATRTRAPEHDETLLDTPLKDVKALRVAAIFGANASGKSNLLLAMRSFQAIVLNSWRAWQPTGPIPTWNPFLLDDKSRDVSTLLEIDFVHNGNVYNYGFEYNQHRFLKEWLIDITGRDRTLFRRTSDEQATSVLFPGRNLPDAKQLDNITKQTRANSLFLSSAAQSGYQPLTQIYMWIIQRFNFLTPNEVQEKSYTAEWCSNEQGKNQVRDILVSSGTGIVDFEIAEEDSQAKPLNNYAAFRAARKASSGESLHDLPLPPLSRKKIKMVHRGEGGKLYRLPFEVESAGTKTLFEMLGPILVVLSNGLVLLIDELETSLHPNLALYILKMFNDPHLNRRGAQLIFATHSASLLDTDLLRRDQIWLAEKTAEGASEFGSLAGYKPRKGQNLAAAYLNGRFGGVPFIDEEAIAAAVQPQPELHVSIAAKDREA